MSHIPFGKRLMRWLDPKGEAQRMDARRARCVAEANAEDLMRTISVNRDKIRAMVRTGNPTSKEK